MRISTKWLVWGGAVLLALTNAVMLVGVASNRRFPPESILKLTERELGPQWDWMWQSGENSGLSLELRLRTEPVLTPGIDDGTGPSLLYSGVVGFYAGSYAGATPWLDRSKLATLGFDVTVLPGDDAAAEHYERMLGRDVLLVLELDGPVRQRALEAARAALARLENSAADPTSKCRADCLRNARDALSQEERQASRLFVVDAGLDRAALQRKYTDPTRYAVVRGQIAPTVIGERSSARLYGRVTAVRCDNINVPMKFRDAIPVDGPVRPVTASSQEPFQVTVAFGRRLEPWILAAHTG
jgi:hypothetical protein